MRMQQIIQVLAGKHIEQARALLSEYASSLDVSLSQQNFESELSNLPGEYSPPKGAFFIALENEQLVGCVAIRPLADDICELKRLYVRPRHRRKGIGTSLVQAAIDKANKIGYTRLRLGTLRTLKEALSIYRFLEFSEILPYKPTQFSDAVFMELLLHGTQA